MRGVLRPTVTEGDIIVRSNSNAATDGSLEGLNRNLDRAREITKNKETYTDIYISPAAIKTVIDTVTNLTSELKGSADEAIKLQQDKAVQEYEKSGKPDGDLFVAMVYKGVDPNVASFLVQQEGFSDILRTQIALNDAIDANSFTQDSFNAEYQPSQSSKRQTLGQAVLLNTVKLGEFIESIPYKEEREAAKKAIQLVTGGPIKFVIAFGIDQAISYLDKVSDNVLSKGYAEVLDNITSKLWTGSYKEEHFEKIGPDGAVFKGELVTIEGEQRVMDAKRPFLAEGISAIVGLAGITKAGKNGAKPLDKAALELEHGKGKVTQGGGNTLQTKESVLNNLEASKEANAASKFKSSVQEKITNAEKISTAKPGSQIAYPRNLIEQSFWKQVESNPLQGKELRGMNRDPRFPKSAGFQKMEATYLLHDGKRVIIHYQYNSIAKKAFDMKIVSPQHIPNAPHTIFDIIKESVR